MKVRDYMYSELVGCEITLSAQAIQHIEVNSDSNFKVLTNECWIVTGYEEFSFSGMMFNIRHYKNNQFARIPESYIIGCEVTGIKFR